MEHTSKSPHVQMLMKGQSVHNQSPAKKLMREKHFSGGKATSPSHFSEGGEPGRKFGEAGIGLRGRFAKGGHCYAEGGETERAYGEKPLTGQLRKGGRARRKHAEGESVEDNSERDEHRKGGRAKRQHHYWGQEIIGRIPGIGDLASNIARTAGTIDENKFGGTNYSPKSKWESLGNIALTGHMKKGGRTKRKHHFAGEGVDEMQPKAGAPVGDNSVRQEQKKGGRSKRQGHYWGQDFFGRLPLIGGIANSIANTAGTLDKDQYGGSDYVADTGGRKAADILATLGNFGANTALSAYGGKKKKGGTVHHEKHRSHRAEGGVGKVRKGMMTKSGRMIHTEK